MRNKNPYIKKEITEDSIKYSIVGRIPRKLKKKLKKVKMSEGWILNPKLTFLFNKD